MSRTDFNDAASKKKGFLSRLLSKKSETTPQAVQINTPSTSYSSRGTQNGPFGRWKELPKGGALEEEIGQMPEWPSDHRDESPVAGWGQVLRGQGQIDRSGVETGGDQTWEYDIEWPSDWASSCEGEIGVCDEQEEERVPDEREILSQFERERESWVREYLPDEQALPRSNPSTLRPQRRNPYLQPHNRDDHDVIGSFRSATQPTREPRRHMRTPTYDVEIHRQQEIERDRTIRARKAEEDRKGRERKERAARKAEEERKERERKKGTQEMRVKPLYVGRRRTRSLKSVFRYVC